MPKHALGRLKNLGGCAERNTKKVRLNAQKKDKENMQASLVDTLLLFLFDILSAQWKH
jgi:hypothetical protein